MSAHFGKGPWDRHGRIQWLTANRIPVLVAKAAQQGGYSSSSHYVRTVILRALEADLGIDFEALQAEEPTKASNKIYSDPDAYGFGSTEQVR